MARWIVDVQGFTEAVNSSDVVLARRRQLKFGTGFTLTDDGTRIVVAGAPGADNTFATALAPFLRGVGLTADANGNLAPRVRPRRWVIEENFISGNATSGQIGRMGWNLLGAGTPAAVRNTGNPTLASAGHLLLSTSAGATDRTTLSLGSIEAMGFAAPSECTFFQAVVQANAVITTKRFFFGFHGNFSQTPSAATNCLGLYFDTAISATKWLFIARIAGVGAAVVSAVDMPSATDQLITAHQSAAGTWDFYAGNTSLGTAAAGAMNATSMSFGFTLQNTTTTAISHFLGGCWAEGSLGGACDDDAFLEA